MQLILLLSMVTLSAIFLISGVSKLTSRERFNETLTAFGVPAQIVPLIGYTLPIVELAIAVGLYVPVTRVISAFAGLTLLLVFTAAIVYNLVRGRTPACNCFGEHSSKPISKKTIYRNFSLILLACLACIGTGRMPNGLDGLISGISVMQALLLVLFTVLAAVLFCAWFLFQLLAQQGRLLIKLERIEVFLGLNTSGNSSPKQTVRNGLPVGQVFPDGEVADKGGKTAGLRSFLHNKLPALLVFAEPNCGPCKALLPRLEEWQMKFGENLSFVIITNGPAREVSAFDSFNTVLFQRELEINKLFGISGTPSAQLLSRDGSIARLLATGEPQILELIQQLEQRLLQSSSTEKTGAGTPLPSVSLPGLDGRLVNLTDFEKQRLFILFWNPQCGYCQRMQPKLKLIAKSLYGHGTKFIILSTGSPNENETIADTATVLLQKGFSASRLFGVNGTPSAIVYNGEGYAESSIRVGADEILELADVRDQVGIAETDREFNKSKF